MDWIVWMVVAAVLGLNVFAMARLWRHDGYAVGSRSAQLLCIWLLPILGPILILAAGPALGGARAGSSHGFAGSDGGSGYSGSGHYSSGSDFNSLHYGDYGGSACDGGFGGGDGGGCDGGGGGGGGGGD